MLSEINRLKHVEHERIVILSFPLSNTISSSKINCNSFIISQLDYHTDDIFFSQGTISLKKPSDCRKPNISSITDNRKLRKKSGEFEDIPKTNIVARVLLIFDYLGRRTIYPSVQRSLTTSCDQCGNISVVLFRHISIKETRPLKVQEKMRIGFNKIEIL